LTRIGDSKKVTRETLHSRHSTIKRGASWTCRTTGALKGPFDKDHPTSGSGGFLPAGVGRYRNHFKLSPSDETRRVFVEFDGIMANSDVWINGFHLGRL
jgi:hypothetical protein